MELTDFLLARIAEEEEVARFAVTPDPPERDEWGLWTTQREPGRSTPRGSVEATPARVLAECEAKRRIVEEYRAALLERAEAWTVDDPRGSAGFEFEVALQCLAVPYASHPDYQQEWSALADA
jgi:hypothetical protein